MPNRVLLKCKGIDTNANSLGSVPEGTLLQADNVVIDKDDILESRRGFKIYGDIMGSVGDRAKQLLNYKDVIIRHFSDVLQYDSLASPGTFTTYQELVWKYSSSLTRSGATATFNSIKPHGLVNGDEVFISGADQSEYNGSFTITVVDDDTFTYTVVGTPVSPATGNPVLETKTAHISQVDANNKIRAVEAVNSNLYFTSNSGIKKLDAVSTYISQAGGIEALDLDLSTVTATTTPVLPQDSQLAYRIVWGYRDLNNNLILGAPSTRNTIGLTVASLIVPDFNSLLNDIDAAAAASLAGVIASNTAANPTVITDTAHGLATGDVITIVGSNSTPLIDGIQTVTVIDANTFSVPVNVTVAGTSGTWTLTQALSETNYFSTLNIPVSSSAAALNGALKALCSKLELDMGYVNPNNARYGRTGSVNAISAANPTQVTTTVAHQLTNGDVVLISGSNSVPSIDGQHIITVTGANTFTIPVEVTGAGTVATWESGIAKNYPVPTTDVTQDYLDQQAFYDEIVDLLLSEPGANISSVGQAVGDFQNSTQGLNVQLVFTVPQGVTTNYFYQIYRSAASVSAETDPGDELGLVYESNPTAAEIIAGTITVVDETVDEFRGADLYTNPRQEGILQANQAPPFAKDIAIYKNIAFYSNTKTKHNKTISLLGVAGLSGTTLTIADVLYTFAGSENIATGQVEVFTAGTPGQNVNDTARSLVRVINRYAANTQVNAFYISGPDDVPGQILLKARSLDQDKFYIMSNSPTVGNTNFSPSVAPENNPIVSNTAANPTVVTTTTAHGLATGDAIYIVNSNSTPSINNLQTVTKLSDTTFSVPVNVTVAGTAGYFRKASTAASSDNEVVKNRVYYSKQNQQEAVPIVNYQDLGSGDKDILRVVALRDSLFVLKQDGIYRITGESVNSLQFALFDNTSNMIGPDTVGVGNNQITALADEGVVTITDVGVNIISRPVENQILPLLPNDNIAPTAFAVFYQTDRKYILWLPEEESDTVATRAWVYNNITGAWTNWIQSKTCALVNTGDDKLYLGPSDINQLEQERKNFDRSDFADREYDLTISEYDASTKIITLSSVLEAEVGDILVQTQVHTNAYTSYNIEIESKILSVDVENSKVTVNAIYDYLNGAVVLYKAYQCKVRWAPEDGGNEGAMKQYREAALRMKKSRVTTPVLGFSSDLQPGVEEIEMAGPGLGNWGYPPWGDVPWGGDSRQRAFRTYIPLGKQRCSILNCEFKHKVAREEWQVEGLALVFEISSERTNR